MPITLPSSRPVKQHSALGFVRDLALVGHANLGAQTYFHVAATVHICRLDIIGVHLEKGIDRFHGGVFDRL